MNSVTSLLKKQRVFNRLNYLKYTNNAPKSYRSVHLLSFKTNLPVIRSNWCRSKFSIIGYSYIRHASTGILNTSESLTVDSTIKVVPASNPNIENSVQDEPEHTSSEELSNEHISNEQAPNAPSSEVLETTPNLSDSNVPAEILETVPDLPFIPEPGTQITEVVLNHLGEPTLRSLGLCNWTPVGFVQWALEGLHVGCGLPWWGAILSSVIILRIAVTPVTLAAQRNTALMSNHYPEFLHLQLKMTQARQAGNQYDAAYYGQELRKYMEKVQFKPLKSLLPQLAQAPIFLSMYFALRKMAELPVASLQTGGFWWFTDLSVADPYYILPLLTCYTLHLAFKLGADSAGLAAMKPLLRYGFLYGFPLIVFPISFKFASVIHCYWIFANVFSLIQGKIYKIPAIRAYMNIPQLTQHSQQPKKESSLGFIKEIKEAYTNARINKEVETREQVRAISFQQAGRAPIQRTFKFDPTKIQTAEEIIAKASKGKIDGK